MVKTVPLDHVLRGSKEKYVATLEDGTSKQFKTEEEMHEWINSMRPKKEKNDKDYRR